MEPLRDALACLGATRIEACLLAALVHREWVLTDDALKLGLRQPEVSAGMRRLVARGLVEVRRVRRQGQGRPRNEYRLVVTPKEVLAPFRAHGEQDVARVQAALVELRKYA